MRKPQGCVTVYTDTGRTIEHDSIICGHCNQIVLVKPGTADTVYYIPQLHGPAKEEPGAFCRQCMSSICLRCAAEGRCQPLELRIEQMEARGRFLKAVAG